MNNGGGQNITATTGTHVPLHPHSHLHHQHQSAAAAAAAAAAHLQARQQQPDNNILHYAQVGGILIIDKLLTGSGIRYVDVHMGFNTRSRSCLGHR